MNGLEAVLLHSQQLAGEDGIVASTSKVQTVPFDPTKSTEFLAKVVTGTFTNIKGIFRQSVNDISYVQTEIIA